MGASTRAADRRNPARRRGNVDAAGAGRSEIVSRAADNFARPCFGDPSTEDERDEHRGSKSDTPADTEGVGRISQDDESRDTEKCQPKLTGDERRSCFSTDKETAVGAAGTSLPTISPVTVVAAVGRFCD